MTEIIQVIEIFQNDKEEYKCQFCETSIDWHQKDNHYANCDQIQSFVIDQICEFYNTKKHIVRVHKNTKSTYNHKLPKIFNQRKSFEEGKSIVFQLISNFTSEDDATMFLNWIKDDALEELQSGLPRGNLNYQDQNTIDQSVDNNIDQHKMEEINKQNESSIDDQGPETDTEQSK